MTPSPTMATTRPSRLQAADDVGLVGRQHLGDDLVDADLGGDGAGRRLVVAGQQHGPQTERPQRGDGLGGASSLTVSATTKTAGPSVPAGGDRGLPARLGGPAGGVELGREVHAPTRPAAPDARRPPRARRRRPRRRGPRGWRSPRRRAAGRAAAAALAMACAIGCSEASSSAPTRRSASSRVDAVGDGDLDEAHPAGGHRAGLVEHDRVDPAGGLQDLGALDEQAELGAAARADHERRRRGQPERARAGDDEHGHRGGEREGRALARAEPEAQRGDATAR